MRTRVRKWGKGLGLRIPKAFAEKLGLGAGCEVEMTVEGQRLVVAPAGSPRFTLEGLLEGVTPENLHGEVDSDPAVGREIGAAAEVEDETAYLLRSPANRARLLAAMRNIEERRDLVAFEVKGPL